MSKIEIKNMRGISSNNSGIEKARKVMREAFEKDESLKRTYEANISMKLYDNSSLNPKTCNDIAEKILKLIF